MQARDVLIGIAGLLAAVAVGYGVGRWTVAAAPAADPARGAEEADQLQVLIAGLEGELEALEARRAELEQALFGDPIPWPDEVEERYRPEAFEAHVRQAVEACAPPVEITGFDCSEPPCFVLLRATGPGWYAGLVDDCPAWSEVYGTETSSFSTGVRCPAGAAERMAMIGPAPAALLGEDAALEERWVLRRDQRIQEAKLGWTCAGR